MPSEDSKVKHIQLRFPALPYMYCNFSWFPKYFHNIMYGTSSQVKLSFIVIPLHLGTYSVKKCRASQHHGATYL